ncbi:hypothetical protein [Thiolapillus sp.]
MPSMFLPGLALAAWSLGKDSLPCLVVLALMFPVLGLIALNMLEVALMRRRAMVGMYLRDDSRLSRLLSRKMFLMLWQVLKATFFTFVLFLEALDWPPWFWWVLLANAILMYTIHGWLRALLHTQVKPGQSGVIARRILVTVNTLLLALLLASGQMFEKQIAYKNMSWQETVLHAAQQEQLACDLMSPLARLQAVQHALAGRFVHQGLESFDNAWSRIAGWLLFFFWSALSLWAWNRALLGTLIRRPDFAGAR